MKKESLNPYCSGQWFRTHAETLHLTTCLVLILIVVDNGFVLDLTRHY